MHNLHIDYWSGEQETILFESWKFPSLPWILQCKELPNPWTMWGGYSLYKGSHIGNVKIGPKGVQCPEMSSVSLSSNFEPKDKLLTLYCIFSLPVVVPEDQPLTYFLLFYFQKFYYMDPSKSYFTLKESGSSLKFSCTNNLPTGFT